MKNDTGLMVSKSSYWSIIYHRTIDILILLAIRGAVSFSASMVNREFNFVFFFFYVEVMVYLVLLQCMMYGWTSLGSVFISKQQNILVFLQQNCTGTFHHFKMYRNCLFAKFDHECLDVKSKVSSGTISNLLVPYSKL